MSSSYGMRRSLEDRIILCADCDATRPLSLLLSGNLVCSACGSENWMHLPVTASIKETFFIKGELRIEEDLSVDGRVEGTVDLGDHNLRVGPHGEVNALVYAKHVIIAGTLVGTITATELVEIRSSGSVEATIKCPRVAIADGARFNGSIETDSVAETAPTLARMRYSAFSGNRSRGLKLVRRTPFKNPRGDSSSKAVN